MTVTTQAIEQARGSAGDTSYLHVPVSARFLRRVRIEAASRGTSMRDFVIESILLRKKGDHADQHANSRK
jgi:hypothetical protein